MHLLRDMASAYVAHRLSSAPAHGRDATDRSRRAEDSAPLRWARDLGFDLSGPRGRLSGVRASDADREQVVSFLKRHCAEGRLSTDELTSRVEAAYTAVSLAELDRLAVDLPGSPFGPEAPPLPLPRARGAFVGPVLHAGAVGGGLLLLLALLSLLAPPEVWATLLMLLVPLDIFALMTILPLALPLVALLLLLSAGGRATALDRGHRRPSLLGHGRGGLSVWRL